MKVPRPVMPIMVYGRASWSNMQAVMWAIAELGLKVTRPDFGHVHGGTDGAAFRAMCPHGLVPVIRDGVLGIWESCAILRYFAARYGSGAPFWPAYPVARAADGMWAEWGKTSFARDFTAPIFWARARARVRVPAAALVRALGRFSALLDILEGQLRGWNFVCGDTFTLADIVIGHVQYRYYDSDVPRGAHPTVQGYYARPCTRPVRREHVMVSYDTLKAEVA